MVKKADLGSKRLISLAPAQLGTMGNPTTRARGARIS